MSIFNNPAVKYNYEEGNGVTLSSCNEPTSTISNLIGSAKVPKENVEGLVNDLSTLTLGIEESCKEFQSFKKHIEHDIEEKEFEFDIFKNVTEQVIKNNRLDLDVFKSAQNMINERHFNHIKKLTRESMIMFFMVILLFVIDLATIWFIIRK